MAKSCLWRHFFGPPRTLFLITAVHFGCVISHAGSHRHQHGEHTEPRLGAYAGAAAAADSHPRPLDAAQGQADARPALTAAARLHRHRRRHRRVLRGFQRGESKQRSVIVNLSSTDCRLAERSCTPARSFLPARRFAGAGTGYGPVSVSVCLSQVGVLSKGMNGFVWFLAWRLLSTSPTLYVKKTQVSTKKHKGTSSWNFS